MKPFKDISWWNEYRTSGIDIQYKLELVNNTLSIYFQPTVSLSDWLLNFSAWVLPYKNMPYKWYAHAGYVKAYKSIREELFNQIKTYKFDTIEIYGYSMGGALATLCHEDCVYNNYMVTTKTWGAPKVIFWPTKKVSSWFVNLDRVNHRRDIVTHIPFFPFMHVGCNCRLGKFGLPTSENHYPSIYMES